MKKIKYPLIVGNWKLNGNKHKIKIFIKLLLDKLNNLRKSYNINNCTIVIAPPTIYLDIAYKFLRDSIILLGSQNVDVNILGSFTGETSIKMLKDVGVKYVIVGHSERRLLHKENDDVILKKFINIKENNLIPILCIGESKLEKDSKQTEKICIKQINSIIENLGIKSFENSVIAYEPIWAIGTSKSANSTEVQSILNYIRKHISKYSEKIAKNIIIQYGGSINTKNAFDFLIKPDINGLLIGKSSLIVEDFFSIIKSALHVSTLNKDRF